MTDANAQPKIEAQLKALSSQLIGGETLRLQNDRTTVERWGRVVAIGHNAVAAYLAKREEN